ncbi:MAG: VWA domain-containing protein [Acidobacteria bacterium]|nr:VWA domain-containing protein [Acidobacteriota bacterium]
MKLLTATFLALVLFSLLIPAGSAEEKPSTTAPDSVPTFRAQTRVVLVDVIVTDSKGQFVPGLKVEDFTVQENHKAQKISGFNVYRYEAPKALPPMQLPPNQYTNFTQQAPGGAVTILMLDTLNTERLEQAYARKAMAQLLRRLPPGQRVGLFILSDKPHLVQGFTSSSDALIAASKSLSPEVSVTTPDRLSGQLSGPSTTAQMPDITTGSALGQSFDSGLGAFAEIAGDVRFRLTLATLNAIARSVSGFSGRKNLLWLSGHFPLRLDAEYVTNNKAGIGGHYSPEVQETATLLAAAQIAVYPVDVKGLGVAQDTFAEDDLARETGGKAFYGNNAVDDALLHGLQQGSDYYTLAYSPENHKWDGQYRKIDVKLAQKGYKLTFRRGYYANEEKPFTGDEAARALATAIQPMVPASTMLLVKAQVLLPDSEHKTVRIDYAVDSHDISFADTADQKKHAAVDFMSVAWDRDFKSAGFSTDTMEADFLPAVYKQIMQTGFPAHQELTLKPGSYTLRLGVIDRGSQKIGTVDVPITIKPSEAAKN